jgi:hypothetical protein
MTAQAAIRVSPGWLRLREAADAAARAPELVDHVRRHLRTGRKVIHDLGSGTGSMGRWLAPRLSGPQHWILHDRDADLLEQAAADPPGPACDGASVTVETRQGDITALGRHELAGASLITASALLDMFDTNELEHFIAACAAPGCPVLVTISVIGRVDLAPADPLDGLIGNAFNAHQRRVSGGRSLLGPDAFGAAVEIFARLGADVLVRESPWHLGAAESLLAIEWLDGWVGAARDEQADLSAVADDYLERRQADARAAQLGVVVHHHDLLALFR